MLFAAIVRGKFIMVFDDVFTGGNTLNAVTRRRHTSGPAATGCTLTSTAARWPSDSPLGTRSSACPPPLDPGHHAATSWARTALLTPSPVRLLSQHFACRACELCCGGVPGRACAPLGGRRQAKECQP